MLLSIVVNLSSTVNGTQSALQATSPLGPWFHYTVPPKEIPGLFQSIRQHLPAYTATRFSTESTLLAAPARIISACGFCHLKRFFFSSAHFASNIKHSFNYWHVFYPAMCNSLLFCTFWKQSKPENTSSEASAMAIKPRPETNLCFEVKAKDTYAQVAHKLLSLPERVEETVILGPVSSVLTAYESTF